MAAMIQHFQDEYLRYKMTGEKALSQVPDSALNRLFAPEGNSAAMIVRHISGNLISRFSDFLTSDGEKPWRRRDTEFEIKDYGRQEMENLWQKGWAVWEQALGSLSDADLAKTVSIRGQALTVHEALGRSLAHLSYHVGQIVLLARMHREGEWQWISVPRGMSEQYNRNPTLEKKPSS